MFPSADEEQWEFIKREIQSSDYYVVIVAGKYGILATDGLSFTEKEYDFAIEIGKPVMGFLFHNLDDLKGSQLEETPAAKEKLGLFRDKVKRGKLVKFYKNSDELKTHVWQSVSHAFNLRPQEGWVRGKNSRRIEDLEEITGLQKRIIELESENARLRTEAKDPRSDLAQGYDLVECQIKLKDIQVSDNYSEGQILRAPTPEFTLSATWDELFIACFTGNNPHTFESSVLSGLWQIARKTLGGKGLLYGDWGPKQAAQV